MSASARQRILERAARRARILADWLAHRDLYEICASDAPEDLRLWARHELSAIVGRHAR